MKKRMFWGAVFGTLLLATAPALADIILSLENPGNGQAVTGITVISGWAFAQNSQPLRLNLLIDGVTREDLPILCCSPRQDVANKVQGAPPNTGFALLFSYGLLTPGPHTIGVQAKADGEPNNKVVEYPVTNVKPGAQSSDPSPLFFGFLDQLSANGARTGLDGEELIIAPVTVVDITAGGTRKATLRLLWASNTQAFGLVMSASDTSFDDSVQPIFTNKCATSGCHDSSTAQNGNLDLSPGKAFKKLVPVKSNQDSNLFRVNPGKSSDSYLYRKIISGGAIASGTRMPPACVNNPGSCLSDSDTQAIAGWIDEGAPPPQQ